MEIRNILIDTNAYAEFRRGGQEAVEIIRHVPLIGVSIVVMGELLSGFAVGSKEQSNIMELNLFFNSERVRLFSADDCTAKFYAKIYCNLRRKGHPVPTNDMWIAATALQHNLAIFSYDKHFKYIDGISAGRRLSDFRG